MTIQATPFSTPFAADAALSVPEAIEARHSIRRFKPAPVPEADMTRILRLASLAPSSNNIQPWRFVIVREAGLKAQLQAAAFDQAQVGAAPVVIAVYSDMQDALETFEDVVHPDVPADRRAATAARMRAMFAGKSEAEREAWGAGQSNYAIAYLTLAAQSLGYATSVMGGFEPEKVKQLLQLPAHVAMPALVALGVADEAGFTAHRHDLARIVREAI